MKKFAVFDIDGTLIRWQLYHVIVDRLAKVGELTEGAESDLKAARKKWKNRENNNSFTEYEKVLIDIFESSLPHLDTDKFDQLTGEVVDEYKDQVYVYTKQLIKDLKGCGYVLLAISGSHHELVEKIAKFYKFDDWIGTQYERQSGTYSGKSFVASHHKAEILKEMIKQHDLNLSGSFAVGDSKSDAPMLEMVENPIAFNPNEELFEIAKENKWNVVVERKNMIYQLEYKNDSYQLK